MKPKASTMQQRMGFADADLTSPKHDDLVLWLVENREEVARSIGFNSDPQFRLSSYGYMPEREKEEARLRFDSETVNQKAKVEILLEKPIMSGLFAIGFIDAIITPCKPYMEAWMEDGKLNCAWSHWQMDGFYVEIKPTTPSFGELLRQLRHYEPYLPKTMNGEPTKMFVCSPDTRFKAALEQQGIGFIVAPQ